MLTKQETINTAKELQENFKRLAYPIEQIAEDTHMTTQEIENILVMSYQAAPGQVWCLRDYLEDMLEKEGIPLYPFSRLADHSANRWFSYDTPWRS
ncbi:DUF2316 family protein [Streptococcus saliviloxodontae]|uniref:DUF2316 family protein n=1 Tax=Streptococcus saliviloxodontae TaxID=1349416 RepID=A0ABS2PJG1_9STRE|nr:DUF2316 family protein [Streptococcus saliviloxodontae]MBM7635486.1 hypothetical protein [Streptococcus saliviloxodontae]